MDDDGPWVDGLRRGNPRAFDLVFAAYRPRVFGFLLRLSGRPELAEDLLQETFLRLASHAHRLEPDTRLRPWLFTVARNLFVSYQRWAWVDGDRLLELGRRMLGWTPDTPHHTAEASESGRRMEAALQTIPAASREVLLLVVLEGMEPSEAAEILGIKPEAARQRLARARAILAASLGGEQWTISRP
jgi:RNA polymerase sigma-70 factor (ECF subfamily)